MATADFFAAPTGRMRTPVHTLRANWGWFLALGIILILVGLAAVSMSFVATMATMTVLGVLALIGAGAEVASALWARRWEGVLLHLVVGLLYGVFGFLVLTRPVQAAAILTLLMASLFLVSGIFRIVVALAVQFHNWGWALLSGVVSLILGVMIWQSWPESGLWVIGLFVGIDLLVTGWTWLILALTVRRLPDPDSPVT